MPALNKLFDKAEKYLQKQNFASAFQTYLEIFKQEPQNEEVLNNLCHLSLRLNRVSESLQYHSQLAEQYIRRNDLPRAIATYRKMLKVSPGDVPTLTKLAGLLERGQKKAEALETYREAAVFCQKAGLSVQALECLKRIVVLDPDNPDAHAELADLAGSLNQPKIAVTSYVRAAGLLRETGQEEDRSADYMERAHTLDPGNEAVSLEVCQLYLKMDRPADVIGLLEPMLQTRPEDLRVAELLARAYLAAEDYAKAGPLCWKVHQADPESSELVLGLMGGLVRIGKTTEAIYLAGKLKDRLFEQGKQNEFLKIMEGVYAADSSNIEILEMLRTLYDELNREEGLLSTLTLLFVLYHVGEKYDKAADTLERILDIDPYGEGNRERLLILEGRIDRVWYQNIKARMAPSSEGSTAFTARHHEASSGGHTKADGLEDLIVEGEIFCHYQLASKLRETVERINRLYPGAEEKNPRLSDLYEMAGFRPKPAPRAAPLSTVPAAAPESDRKLISPNSQILDGVRKIPEITSSIFHEATAQGVMQTAVNQIGQALEASRCWGAMGQPGRGLTLSAEYCSPSTSPSETNAILKVCSALIQQASKNPEGWLVENAPEATLLLPVRAEVEKLGIRSMLGLPLFDKDEIAGMLIIEQCDRPRAWASGESVLLKAIAPQIITAVKNTKLRRLIKSLAGADPETGLLPPSSYIDCLLTEARRCKAKSTPLSVSLLEPENSAGLAKSLGNGGVQRYFQQLSKTAVAAIRQNDIAVRYNPLAIALVFPDTPLPQAGVAVERLRRVLSQVMIEGTAARNLCAAVCEISQGPEFDAVDGVTELINRLEVVLEQARKEGGKRTLLSKYKG